MINIGSVSIYVEDVEKSLDFWTNKVGFDLINTVNAEAHNMYEIGTKEQTFTLSLVPKAIMGSNEFGINLGTPSIVFQTDDLKKTNLKMKESGIKCTEINEYKGLQNFTFFDDEEQAFAMTEK